MKLRAMISQPMSGRGHNEIMMARERAKDMLEGLGYEVVNTMFEDEHHSIESMRSRGVKHFSMNFLSSTVEVMSTCDVVYFCKDWSQARGCMIEHDIAVAYGLTIMHEV